MPVIAIASADDPRVHDYRAVREPELVRRRGLFIAEGRLVVARLVALPRYRIHSILVSEAGLAALREQAGDGLAPRDVPIYVAAPDDHRRDRRLPLPPRLPRDCRAAAGRSTPARSSPPRRRAVRSSSSRASPRPTTSAASCATRRRSAPPACCSIRATVDPLYRKALRTAMGAALVVPWARLEPWPEALAASPRRRASSSPR